LVAKWRPYADEIIATGSNMLLKFSPDPETGEPIAATVANAWQAFLEEAGLQLT
jgi:hypothetical protein